MKSIHIKNMHIPSAHAVKMETSHLIHDPRFWAVLAMVLLTVLVIALAIATRPGGPIESPTVPGPYIY